MSNAGCWLVGWYKILIKKSCLFQFPFVEDIFPLLPNKRTPFIRSQNPTNNSSERVVWFKGLDLGAVDFIAGPRSS